MPRTFGSDLRRDNAEIDPRLTQDRAEIAPRSHLSLIETEMSSHEHAAIVAIMRTHPTVLWTRRRT